MYAGHWVPYTGSEEDVMGSAFPLQYMGYASVLAFATPIVKPKLPSWLPWFRADLWLPCL